MREKQIHPAIIEFLRWALPIGAVLHHSPNEGRRGWTAQRDLKTHGTRPGWPDIEIGWNASMYFIEVKAPKKYPTAEQRLCHRELRAAGFKVAACRSVVEVEMTLQKWGVPLRARIDGCASETTVAHGIAVIDKAADNLAGRKTFERSLALHPAGPQAIEAECMTRRSFIAFLRLIT